MNRFLVPTRIVFDQISPTERDEYKKKGIHMLKILNSWKKWSAMEHAQKIKFINAIYALSASHAQCIDTAVITNSSNITHTVEDTIASHNRTMHCYARVMHVMSCSNNLAAVTKAFGRYTRYELDEAKSKLSEDLEVCVSGWKQLTYVFNDSNVSNNFPLFYVIVFIVLRTSITLLTLIPFWKILP